MDTEKGVKSKGNEKRNITHEGKTSKYDRKLQKQSHDSAGIIAAQIRQNSIMTIGNVWTDSCFRSSFTNSTIQHPVKETMIKELTAALL